ncbi:MAG: DinB family protein [Planctomycetota bacterium]|jgi:hypothetical protein
MAGELQSFLASQFEYVRRWTLMSCEGVPDDLLVSVPPGTNSHVLWEIGHVVWTENYLVSWGCAGGARLPGEWDEEFGFGSKPVQDLGEYPPFDRVIEELGEGRDRTRAYVLSLSLDALRSPPPNLSSEHFPQCLDAFTHFLSHEAYHVGKASQIRKMLGLPSVAELFLGG